MADLMFSMVLDTVSYFVIFFSLRKTLIFKYNKLISYIAIMILFLFNALLNEPFVDYALENNLNNLVGIAIGLFMIGLVSYFIIMFKDKFRYRIIFAITYLSLLAFNSLSYNMLSTLFFKYDSSTNVFTFSLQNVVVFILSTILTFVISSLVGWFFKKLKLKISAIYLLVIPFIILSELILLSICFNTYMFNTNLLPFYPKINYIFITTIFVTISNILLLYLLAKVVEKIETEEKYSSLELEHKLQCEAIYKINLANDKEKQFNHDIKNQLYTIDILLKNKDNEEALNITKKLSNNLRSLK